MGCVEGSLVAEGEYYFGQEVVMTLSITITELLGHMTHKILRFGGNGTLDHIDFTDISI